MQKDSVSKHGRKPAKAEPSVHKDPFFDKLVDDTLDYMDTKNAQDMGRSRFVVHEEKEREEKEVSTDSQGRVSIGQTNEAKALRKKKRIELKDVEETKDLAYFHLIILTLNPLPKTDPKG
ncbi:hypothetical protein Tco_0271856 [Tanacetum coccineum]